MRKADVTTIGVSKRARNRIKVRAAQAGISIIAYVDLLLKTKA